MSCDQSIDYSSVANCDNYITPACVRALYDIPKATKNHSQNAIGVFESGGPYAPEDLNVVFTHCAPDIPNSTQPTNYRIDGGVAPISPYESASEANLDLDVIFPLVFRNE